MTDEKNIGPVQAIIDAHSEDLAQKAVKAFSDAAMELAKTRWPQQNTKLTADQVTPELVAAEIVKERDNISVAEVYGWLIGHDVPSRPETKFALIDILAKTDNWEGNEHTVDAGNSLLTLRDAAKAAIGDHTIPPLTGEQMRAHLTPRKRGTHTGGGHSTFKTHESDGMPQRMNQTGKRYETLKNEILGHYLWETPHLPEMLTIARLLLKERHVTQQELKDLINKETGTQSGKSIIAQYEIGMAKGATILPPIERLTALTNILFADETKAPLKEKALHLLLQNRSQIINAAYNSTHRNRNTIIAAHELEMPPEYFIEKLRRTNGGAEEEGPDWTKVRTPKTAEEPASEKPVAMVPIERNYQYLDTVIRALGLSWKDASQVTGYTEETLKTYCSYNVGEPHTKGCAQAMQKLEAYAKEHDKPDLINMDTYRGLDDGPLQSHIDLARLRKTAGTIGLG